MPWTAHTYLLGRLLALLWSALQAAAAGSWSLLFKLILSLLLCVETASQGVDGQHSDIHTVPATIVRGVMCCGVSCGGERRKEMDILRLGGKEDVCVCVCALCVRWLHPLHAPSPKKWVPKDLGSQRKCTVT